MGIEASFFSVRSAYAAIDGSGDSERDELWRFVRKLAVPQRDYCRVLMHYPSKNGFRPTFNNQANSLVDMIAGKEDIVASSRRHMEGNQLAKAPVARSGTAANSG
ncbi:hypothetical protein V6N13_012044 [Hibiscus sabdariffa]